MLSAIVHDAYEHRRLLRTMEGLKRFGRQACTALQRTRANMRGWDARGRTGAIHETSVI